MPAPDDPVTDRLDRQLLATPHVAIDNLAQILVGTGGEMFDVVQELLDGRPVTADILSRLEGHLDAVHGFADRLHLQPEQRRDWRRLTAAFHLLDHLQRMHERCEKEHERALQLGEQALLAGAARDFGGDLDIARAAIASPMPGRAEPACNAAADRIRGHAEAMRAAIMADVAAGRIDVPTGTRRLEAVRWLRRVSHHVWRVVHYAAKLTRDIAIVRSGAIGNDLNS